MLRALVKCVGAGAGASDDERYGKYISTYADPCSLPKLFFLFFLISSYVGFVPVSDVLAIFVSDRRCEFW